MDLPSNDKDAVLNITQELKDFEWITPGTRMVFITFAVYSANLDGAYASVRFAFEFAPTGVITPFSDITVLSPNSYTRDISGPGIARVVLELIVVIYVWYAFILQEFREVQSTF